MRTTTIYIEVSDEITTVIERLKSVNEPQVVLVVPKGAILLQSIVNLKLARKAATDVAKQIVLVTTDKTGTNLAQQVGIPVVSDEKDALSALNGEQTASAPEEDGAKVIAGVPVHRYYDEKDAGDTSDTSTLEASSPIIIPKQILKEELPKENKTTEANEKASTTDTKPVTPAPDPAPAPTETKPAPESTPAKKKSGAPRLRFALFVVGLLGAGGIAVSFLLLPKTTAVIAVPTETWEKTWEFTATTAASAVSEDSSTLPAELLAAEVTDSIEFTSTGTKRVGEQAKGTATIYNGSDSDTISLPAGAKLVANGRTFTTDSAVSVPGVQFKAGKKIDGSINVSITADDPGPESNLSSVAAVITTPSTSLYASIVSTSGGSSREVKVVSATDVANAKTSLTNKLRDTAVAQLTEQIKNRDVRYSQDADNFGITDVAVSVQVGEEAEKATITAKGSLKRLVVDYADISSASATRTNLAFADLQGKQTIIIDDPIEVTTLSVGGDGTQASLATKVTGKQSAIIPVEALRKELAGKTDVGGKSLIETSIPGSATVITHSPRWWPIQRFPYNAKFLTVTVTYE